MTPVSILLKKFRKAACFVAGLFAVLLTVPALAAEDPVYTVEGVQIDVTADSAAKARTQALEQAPGLAFETLAGRLLSEDKLPNFKMPDVMTISGMISDFEVTSEKLSRVRYIGTYTFRFNGNAVRNHISSSGFSYTDVGSKPVLVLPFLQVGGQTILWGEGNPWLTAWTKQVTTKGLVPVTVPIGDLEDTADIADNDALTFEQAKMDNMTLRYRAGRTIILTAVPAWNDAAATSETMPDSLQIMMYGTDAGPQFQKDMTVTSADIKDSETLFDAAARLSRKMLQNDWKSKTLTDASQTNKLKVRVAFASAQEWVEMQKMLNHVQGVNEVQLISLTPAAALVELRFSGTEERLRLALAQSDMTLTAPQVSFGSGAAISYDLFMNKRHQAPIAPAATQTPYAAPVYAPSPYTYQQYR